MTGVGERLGIFTWLGVAVCFAGLSIPATAQSTPGAETSDIRQSEQLVLFPAAASLAPGGQQWVVPVHAWVYVPQASRVRRAVIAALLKAQYGLDVTPSTEPIFDERINMLLANNKRGRRIVVEIAGTRAALPPTGPNGHIATDVHLPANLFRHGTAQLEIKAILPGGDTRIIKAPLQLIPPKGLSVISDIDDTVKITHVTDRKRLWETTLFSPFAAVPGMAEAYQRLAKNDTASFHYVSSSPWQLAEALRAFVVAAGLPLSSLSLKHIRLKDRSALNIFSPGRITKPPAIAKILAQFPERNFILIGDSGEDDPEVYAAAKRANPDRISRIYIRNVTHASRDDARFAGTFAGIAAQHWDLFDDPNVIRAP